MVWVNNLMGAVFPAASATPTYERMESRQESHLDKLLAEEANRAANQQLLLQAVNRHHDAVMDAKYGQERFRQIAAPCRVFGKVEDLGMDGGMAASIEKIKRHAVSQAEAAVKAAHQKVAPDMYDVEWVDATGVTQTTRMLTTAVYVLTEDEMSQLEALLTAHCRGISKEDVDVD